MVFSPGPINSSLNCSQIEKWTYLPGPSRLSAGLVMGIRSFLLA